MELSSIQIETTKSIVVEEQDEMILVPLGDLQLDPEVVSNGSVIKRRSADLDRFKRTLQWGLDHNAYFIGMGDMADVGSPSNRRALKQANLYDSTLAALERSGIEIYEELRDVLAPSQGRWLGMLEGHHFWEFEDGSTTDTRLARDMGAPFLGTSTMLNVRFAGDYGKRRRPNFTIWGHHGRGGGKLLSGPINQLEHMIKGFDADVYLVGHHHKVISAKSQVLAIEPGRTEPRLVHKDTLLTSTGSFLRGYMQGSRADNRPRGNYPEQGMMTPVALGAVAVFARPSFDNNYTSVQLNYMSL